MMASTTASGAPSSNPANSRLLPTSRLPDALVVAVNVTSTLLCACLRVSAAAPAASTRLLPPPAGRPMGA